MRPGRTAANHQTGPVRGKIDRKVMHRVFRYACPARHGGQIEHFQRAVRQIGRVAGNVAVGNKAVTNNHIGDCHRHLAFHSGADGNPLICRRGRDRHARFDLVELAAVRPVFALPELAIFHGEIGGGDPRAKEVGPEADQRLGIGDIEFRQPVRAKHGLNCAMQHTLLQRVELNVPSAKLAGEVRSHLPEMSPKRVRGNRDGAAANPLL